MHFDCLFIVLSLHTLVKLKCSHPALRVLYPDWINTVCHVGQLTVRQTPEESEPPPPPSSSPSVAAMLRPAASLLGVETVVN